MTLAPTFYKSQSALILLPLLSRSQPLALGCNLVLGSHLEACPQNCLSSTRGRKVRFATTLFYAHAQKSSSTRPPCFIIKTSLWLSGQVNSHETL